MKILLIGALVSLSTILTACNSMSSNHDAKPVGMANPASKYCIEQGGKLLPQKDKNGAAFALCQLPNGQTTEEWELYRQAMKK